MPMIILQCCHFEIVISRVAVIENVKNVCLQRRHRPTDDAPLVYEVSYANVISER